MKEDSKQHKNCQSRINHVMPTEEKITGKGSLNLFAEYIENLNILGYLVILFGGLRKHFLCLNNKCNFLCDLG